MIEITPQRFFKVAIILFVISAICGIANFFIYFEAMNFFSRISTLANIVFQVILVASFMYALKMTAPVIQSEEVTDTEISKIIEEVQGGKHTRAQKETRTSKGSNRKSQR